YYMALHRQPKVSCTGDVCFLQDCIQSEQLEDITVHRFGRARRYERSSATVVDSTTGLAGRYTRTFGSEIPSNPVNENAVGFQNAGYVRIFHDEGETLRTGRHITKFKRGITTRAVTCIQPRNSAVLAKYRTGDLKRRFRYTRRDKHYAQRERH